MVSYFFGGDSGLTPEDIKRQRMLAAALAESRTPQNVGEGVGAVMRGIAGALVNARANSAERAGRQSANEAMNPILEALKSPFTPDTSAADTSVTTTTPDFSSDAAIDPKKTAPSSIMDKSLPPVKGTMENARTGDRNSVQDYAGLDLKSGIKAAADSLGIKPEDLATAISYETAGTFDPLKKGPRTKWGQHRGLIQFGEPQAKEHGVDWNDPLNSQLGPDGAVVKYLRAAGVKPGMELIDIYSAINAGGVDRHNASDEKNGGAWGTVADKVKYQMDGHRKKALALFADPETPATAFDAQPKPVEVASLDGNVPLPGVRTATEQVPVVDVPEGFEQPDPLQAQQKPAVKVAQADGLTETPKRARNEPSDDVVIKALTNPWATDEQRAIAEMYYKQRISEREFQRKLEAERNDPKYKMDLEKGQLEIDKLKNPPKSRRMTDEEERAAGLDTSGVYEVDPTDKISVIQQPKKRNTATVNGRIIDLDTGEMITEVPQQISPIDQERMKLDREKFAADKEAKGKLTPAEQARLDLDKQKFEFERTKPTQDIQEYQFYEQAEKAAGRQPLGPLEWDQARRKAGAQTSIVNNNMKTESKFDEKLAEKQAETFSTMADEGLTARSDMQVIDQLDGFLKGQGGAITGLSSTLSKWGIPFEGADDLQAADALINKLVPTQRTAGSGTMSDRDVQLFKDSLPSLWNQPGGNEKIIGVMRGMAQYKAAQGEIADQVINGEMTRQEARRALRELPNPLEEFRKAKKDEPNAEKAPAEEPASGIPKQGDIIDGYRFKGGDPADPANWEITEGGKVQ